MFQVYCSSFSSIKKLRKLLFITVPGKDLEYISPFFKYDAFCFGRICVEFKL